VIATRRVALALVRLDVSALIQSRTLPAGHVAMIYNTEDHCSTA